MIRNNIKENTDRKALAAHVSGMYLLTEEHEKKVADASEVDEIFYILPKYWSILDFGNLDDIAKYSDFVNAECLNSHQVALVMTLTMKEWIS